MIVLWGPHTHCSLRGPSRLEKALTSSWGFQPGLSWGLPCTCSGKEEHAVVTLRSTHTWVGHQHRRHQGGRTRGVFPGVKPRPRWPFGRWSLASLLNLLLAWHRSFSSRPTLSGQVAKGDTLAGTSGSLHEVACLCHCTHYIRPQGPAVPTPLPAQSNLGSNPTAPHQKRVREFGLPFGWLYLKDEQAIVHVPGRLPSPRPPRRGWVYCRFIRRCLESVLGLQ